MVLVFWAWECLSKRRSRYQMCLQSLNTASVASHHVTKQTFEFEEVQTAPQSGQEASTRTFSEIGFGRFSNKNGFGSFFENWIGSRHLFSKLWIFWAPNAKHFFGYPNRAFWECLQINISIFSCNFITFWRAFSHKSSFSLWKGWITDSLLA